MTIRILLHEKPSSSSSTKKGSYLYPLEGSVTFGQYKRSSEELKRLRSERRGSKPYSPDNPNQYKYAHKINVPLVHVTFTDWNKINHKNNELRIHRSEVLLEPSAKGCLWSSRVWSREVFVPMFCNLKNDILGKRYKRTIDNVLTYGTIYPETEEEE